MALEAHAPVIPVGIFGTPEIMPLDKKMPRLKGQPSVVYGKPLSFERYYDRPTDRFVLRSVTDEIMYEIMMITGQEYVDEYASKVKKQLAAAEKRPVPTFVAGDQAPEKAEEQQPAGS
jgi:1-acyl-sn-glycerol-3-phosphate acyltransferase